MISVLGSFSVMDSSVNPMQIYVDSPSCLSFHSKIISAIHMIYTTITFLYQTGTDFSICLTTDSLHYYHSHRLF